MGNGDSVVVHFRGDCPIPLLCPLPFPTSILILILIMIHKPPTQAPSLCQPSTDAPRCGSTTRDSDSADSAVLYETRHPRTGARGQCTSLIRLAFPSLGECSVDCFDPISMAMALVRPLLCTLWSETRVKSRLDLITARRSLVRVRYTRLGLSADGVWFTARSSGHRKERMLRT